MIRLGVVRCDSETLNRTLEWSLTASSTILLSQRCLTSRTLTYPCHRARLKRQLQVNNVGHIQTLEEPHRTTGQLGLTASTDSTKTECKTSKGLLLQSLRAIPPECSKRWKNALMCHESLRYQVQSRKHCRHGKRRKLESLNFTSTQMNGRGSETPRLKRLVSRFIRKKPKPSSSRRSTVHISRKVTKDPSAATTTKSIAFSRRRTSSISLADSGLRAFPRSTTRSSYHRSMAPSRKGLSARVKNTRRRETCSRLNRSQKRSRTVPGSSRL